MAIEGYWLLKVETVDGNVWATVQAETSEEALFRLVGILARVPGAGGRMPELKAIRYMQRGPGVGEAASMTISKENGFWNTRGNQEAWALFGMHAYEIERAMDEALHKEAPK